MVKIIKDLAEVGTRKILAGIFGMKWKRAYIPQSVVLMAFSNSKRGGLVDTILKELTGAPDKVIWAAMEREERRGMVDYGVSLRGGWLTAKGRMTLWKCLTE